jgi:para-aminobenzoate synthetase/4-amino-4-deoxychorismate lyase
MQQKSNQPEQSAAWRPLPRSFRQRAAENMPAVLLETSRRTPSAKSYLFTDPIAVLEPRTPDELHSLFARIDEETARGRWIAGYIAYEAGYALEPKLAPKLASKLSELEANCQRLAWIGIFDSVEIFDHTTPGQWEQPEATAPITEAIPELTESPVSYSQKVQQIREWIASGDTYQANLTLQASWPAISAQSTYEAAMAAQPVEFGAWLRLAADEEILSASPELFFKRNGPAIRTAPMKGTAPRGRYSEEDQQQAAWLAQDPKNRAENLMIVDLLRNDLGRICEIGSIHVDQLFTIERFPSVLQMTSSISGLLRPNLSTADIFRALFPSGSIVGAPKIRTMQLLHQLEQRQRGVYTGAIGFQGPGNQATWNVAIRTMHLRNDKAQMGTGSGITWDSDAASEFAECKTKLAFVQRSSEPFHLIETMLWDNRFERLEAHIARIRASAAYFDRPFDEPSMRDALQAATHAFANGSRWRVRLLMDTSGAFQVSATELHEEAGDGLQVKVGLQAKDGLRLLLTHPRTDSADIFLFHKTTRRLLYDDALARARAIGCSDALFRNQDGEITEGAIHNIFVELHGQVFTPPIASGLLPGIFRAEWAREQSATERSLTLEDLREARSITLTNSVRGARQVREVLVEDESGRLTTLWRAGDGSLAGDGLL